MRSVISTLPKTIKYIVCDLISLVIYYPTVKIGKFLRFYNILPKNWPLTYYLDLSFYVLRTDSLDRFGTKLEKRYSQKQITQILSDSGFHKIKFSTYQPYWCAIAFKK